MTITIKPAETMADCNAISHLEGEIWGDEGPNPALLMSIRHAHGTMLMALDESANSRVIGFCYSFISYDERSGARELNHYSFVLGIDEAYRDRNIGYALKMAQRDMVLKQGIRLMRWTFDPLETRNANLNLFKLRAICQTYYPSFYGLKEDALNGGIDTDRFMVDWWVDSDWVSQPIELPQTRIGWLEKGAIIVNPTIKHDEQHPRPNDAIAPLEGQYILLEVPDNMQLLKTADLPLAQHWRRHTRRLFQELFSIGYAAISLIREAGRCYYVLEKDWTQNLG